MDDPIFCVLPFCTTKETQKWDSQMGLSRRSPTAQTRGRKGKKLKANQNPRNHQRIVSNGAQGFTEARP